MAGARRTVAGKAGRGGLRRHRVAAQARFAWKLLRADNAPLIFSFLHKVFVAENTRSIAESDLVSRLDDELYALNERLGEQAFPKPAQGLP